jgi:YHS domain-containing protein
MQDMPASGHQGHEMLDKKAAVSQKVIDPVCGMEAIVDEEHSFTYKGTKYYFCSTEDLDKFKKDPEKYAGQTHQH